MSQREDDLELVERGNAIEEGLTDWEVDFVESMNNWMKNHDTLTEKQRSTLLGILDKKEN